MYNKKINKSIFALLFLSCLSYFIWALPKSKNTNNKEINMTSVENVAIKTPHGEIVIKLFPDIAPKHVESFLKLTKSGFYNGTIFHRVIPGFMIQGGDPNSKDPNNRAMHGTGGPGYNIPAEFSKKEHVRGILSAARSQDPNSAGSQFFIMVAKSPHLDGQYSIFGEVIQGMDVVDKIVAEPRDGRDNPIKPMTIEASIVTQ